MSKKKAVTVRGPATRGMSSAVPTPTEAWRMDGLTFAGKFQFLPQLLKKKKERGDLFIL